MTLFFLQFPYILTTVVSFSITLYLDTTVMHFALCFYWNKVAACLAQAPTQ